MKEGTTDEMSSTSQTCLGEARHHRLEDRSVSHQTFVGRMCVSAERVTKMWSASLFKHPEECRQEHLTRLFSPVHYTRFIMCIRPHGSRLCLCASPHTHGHP